jgi:hypothetical protein
VKGLSFACDDLLDGASEGKLGSSVGVENDDDQKWSCSGSCRLETRTRDDEYGICSVLEAFIESSRLKGEKDVGGQEEIYRHHQG